jgi:hypothetical protein
MLKLSFFTYRHLYYGTTTLFSIMNGLKEDTLVDIPDTHTLPQLILILSLFTLLIGWLVIFAYLALRPAPEKRTEQMEHTAALPAIKSPVGQTLPVTPRAPSIRTITKPTPIVTVSTDSTREIVLDHSRH